MTDSPSRLPQVMRTSQLLPPASIGVLDATRRVLAGEAPLWSHAEFLERFGQDFLNYRVAWARERNVLSFSSLGDDVYNPQRSIDLFHERDRYIHEFGFSIPCREAIEALVDHGAVLEIGAGTGLWSELIRNAGGNVIATDYGQSRYGFEFGWCHPVEQLAGKTSVRRYRDRTVLCSWPSLNKTWFRQALKAMRVGQYLFYVEEDCTAESTARQLLEDFFQYKGRIEIPCWQHIHDALGIYRKVRQRAWRPRAEEW